MKKHPANWKGGKFLCKNRWQILAKGHPRADSKGYVYQSLIVAEKALGKYLPITASIHHVDKDTTNDSNNNLVVCENHPYHIYLHTRERALKACGNVNWRKCKYCFQHDDIKNMSYKKHYRYYHKRCANQYNQSLKRRKEIIEI